MFYVTVWDGVSSWGLVGGWNASSAGAGTVAPQLQHNCKTLATVCWNTLATVLRLHQVLCAKGRIDSFARLFQVNWAFIAQPEGRPPLLGAQRQRHTVPVIVPVPPWLWGLQQGGPLALSSQWHWHCDETGTRMRSRGWSPGCTFFLRLSFFLGWYKPLFGQKPGHLSQITIKSPFVFEIGHLRHPISLAYRTRRRPRIATASPPPFPRFLSKSDSNTFDRDWSDFVSDMSNVRSSG